MKNNYEGHPSYDSEGIDLVDSIISEAIKRYEDCRLGISNNPPAFPALSIPISELCSFLIDPELPLPVLANICMALHIGAIIAEYPPSNYETDDPSLYNIPLYPPRP